MYCEIFSPLRIIQPIFVYVTLFFSILKINKMSCARFPLFPSHRNAYCLNSHVSREKVKFVWDRIFLHATSPSSQWSPIFLLLLEMLRRASDTLKKESRFSELIHRLVNMPFRELCEGRGASSMITEAGRCVSRRESRCWLC